MENVTPLPMPDVFLPLPSPPPCSPIASQHSLQTRYSKMADRLHVLALISFFLLLSVVTSDTSRSFEQAFNSGHTNNWAVLVRNVELAYRYFQSLNVILSCFRCVPPVFGSITAMLRMFCPFIGAWSDSAFQTGKIWCMHSQKCAYQGCVLETFLAQFTAT